ncbi:histidine kinase [Streptomyces sp. NBC_00121]|uniref:sensor histidine kinase n=1 Tax=unclassified Streptomyces TaxID=2593676 RepID=UPI0028C3ECB6|nr:MULTISPECIES: histidine kinase [unclassified Streptomyces]WNO69845.1 histidine kinase [Streptomyces sp. AM2-3-1]WSC74540.1 histidine kinase [Streptomyces sp. NBC_01760]WTE65046.1 histidine kinase [Streptomyces sp. NBC_01617]WTI92408.1 histidine kinase [Streptomyces sp. NBC_00724]
MRVRDWRRGWQERSKLQRIDLYSRFTVSVLPWIFTLSWDLAPFSSDIRRDPLPLTLGGVLLLVGLGQCVLSNRNVKPSYDHCLGRSVFPRRRLAAPLALLVLGLGLPATLCGVGGIDDDGLLLLVMNAPVPFAITQVLLVPVRTFLVQSLVLTALTTGLFAAAGLRGGVLAGVVPATLFGCLLVLVSVRPGVWSLSVMWQAEKARDLQARLAVAEERLRFGRDMHDVLGRNLAVIALKSELAVELAQRGRAEAVDQMVEVQRIARASQQEVRDVVRGYREVDLSTELVGAQGVLKAAGIVCEVTGDGGGQLPAAVQSALGWAVREAATNVLRHGDPRLCTIRLSVSADGVVLDVENDGAPCAAAGESGSGLAGLRERLGALDGSLDAGPVGDGMFRLTARIPLTRGESRPAALEGRR